MTVPCTCKIPDPVVVNGQCLVCYGDRPTEPDENKALLDELTNPDALKMVSLRGFLTSWVEE